MSTPESTPTHLPWAILCQSRLYPTVKDLGFGLWRARTRIRPKIVFDYLQLVLRIRDVYPGSWFLPIPDPGSRISDPRSKNSNKREGWKKICCHNFLCSHKFHKIANYFSLFWSAEEKNLGQFSKNFLPKKLSISSQKYGVGIRDPRSGIRKKPIPDPGSRGVKKAPDPGSRIRIRNTACNPPPPQKKT